MAKQRALPMVDARCRSVKGQTRNLQPAGVETSVVNTQAADLFDTAFGLCYVAAWLRSAHRARAWQLVDQAEELLKERAKYLAPLEPAELT